MTIPSAAWNLYVVAFLAVIVVFTAANWKPRSRR
jgi:hypothetical protein